MNRFQKTIRVVSNPYSALDHKGRPCGIFPVEPEGGSAVEYIGARIDRELTTVRVADKGDLRGSRMDTVFAFRPEPVEVRASEYYRDGLKSGAILPADQASAEFAGLKFTPVETAREATKKLAIANFDALYGAGAHETLTGAAAPAPEAKKTRKAD